MLSASIIPFYKGDQMAAENSENTVSSSQNRSKVETESLKAFKNPALIRLGVTLESCNSGEEQAYSRQHHRHSRSSK